MHDTIKRSRELLARLSNCAAEYAADQEKRNARHADVWQLSEDPRRAQAPTETEEEIMQRNFEGWEEWLDGHLKNFAQMIGEEIGESDRAINARLAALEQAVGEMKAEQAVERAAAEIIDLPDWRTKNENAA
jgi:hypothetical protein